MPKSKPGSFDQTVDRFIAAVVSVLAFGLFLSTFNSEWFAISDPDEAETVLVPRLILLCLVFLSGLLVARHYIGSTIQTVALHKSDWSARAPWKRLLAACGVMTFVAALLVPFGFLPTMSLGIALLGWTMGYRRLVSLSVVAIFAPLFAWYLIVEVAELSLPAGPFLKILGLA